MVTGRGGLIDALTVGGLVLALLLAVGWYLSYTAVRLDRLHHRLVGTAAALDAQLVRRAEATMEAALGGDLDPATATLLVAAASEALDQPGEWTPERAEAESELTELLRVADRIMAGGGAPSREGDDPLERLRGSALRVQYAHQFHNEAVADTRVLHQQPAVRWFRLMGHTETPTEVTFDDVWPAPDVH